MIKPTPEQAEKYFKDYTVIPIYKELFADVKTSVEVLRNFVAQNKKCFLLESVESVENWGRYSFLGCDPTVSIQYNDGKAVITAGDKKETKIENPAVVLRGILSRYKSPKIAELPPFTGGLVGYFSYDYIKYVEKSLNLTNRNAENFDDLHLMLFDKVIAFDHFKQKIFIIVNAPVQDFENSFKKAQQEIDVLEKLILSQLKESNVKSGLKSELNLLHNEEDFSKMIATIKHHIHEGDIFQAVISNGIEAQFEGNLLQTYRTLRTINPSPYMFYLNFADSEIAGASPETLVTLKDGELTNYALAGTTKRGKTPKEDDELIAALLSDEKELSEHNMLVDLGRNDLGKISEFGSVKVEEYMKILKFSHVSHIASVIKGKIKSGYDQFDAVAAVLPAGTLSGAPKIKACEIINSLEKHKRGTYGGAIGYIDFTGNMDMCIAIRMAKFQNGKIYVQAGAGIVADSNPQKEFQECLNKAQAVVSAIKIASEGDAK
ncbi:anthranilate synthase component I [Endomicrobium proavitum]|uniref:Anthranilate synthase component 1 n=1 Tax=Endomicrobium proavitum TaxID=1408281 RepID=A0A0G3WJP7_9BACT|nr:anthranilate synthase component I [Endomicrobium proavitum]AKL98087.1 Anthranilate synthase component 1 [Endomicrobium proavitum]